ncbi:MAG: hypothetical protein LBB15_02550 [Puniceicoccales bacterium]|jgi:hypothetical protein|nr:hypothetical protein [Puniceicoccales bacterium]
MFKFNGKTGKIYREPSEGEDFSNSKGKDEGYTFLKGTIVIAMHAGQWIVLRIAQFINFRFGVRYLPAYFLAHISWMLVQLLGEYARKTAGNDSLALYDGFLGQLFSVSLDEFCHLPNNIMCK